MQTPEEGAITRGWPVDDRPTLQNRLAGGQPTNALREASTAIIESLAGAAIDLAEIIAAGPLAGITGENGGINTSGDTQKDIDVAADRLMRDALRNESVASILSEEAEVPELRDAAAPLCVAIDPLDGSANLENNLSVGTIFSIRPKTRDAISTFFEPGTAQCAAGFFIYGPQTVDRKSVV